MVLLIEVLYLEQLSKLFHKKPKLIVIGISAYVGHLVNNSYNADKMNPETTKISAQQPKPMLWHVNDENNH